MATNTKKTRSKKIFIAGLAIVGAVSAVTFIPSTSTIYDAQGPDTLEVVTNMMAPSEPTPTEYDKAAAELKAANDRISVERARLLSEIDTATSTAAAQIASIEAERDETVDALQSELEKLNALVLSFQ